MKKRNLWITILLIILSLCFTMGLTACDDDDNGGNGNSGTLEKITVVVDKTEAEIGDTINLSFTTTPENPTSAHNGSSYKASCIEYYVRINGSDTRISTQKVTTTYTVNSSDDLSFWAKYCNHSTHSDTEGDLVSELVTVTIKTSTISTVDELKAIANTNKSYILANDIDLAGESNWQAIEGFSGTLNGTGHSITNLTINSVNGENIGLFGTLQGTVKDLIIENAQITARGDAGKAGIVAGTNKGTISNVTVSGNIAPEYYSYVGGLVGYNECGKVVNCTNQATVIGANNVGGIVGSVVVNTNDAITSCTNEGIITGKDNVGGIAGYLTCVRSNATYQISNNTNKNTVTGDNRVGGIFGEVYAFYEYYKYDDYNSYFEMSVLTNSAEVTGSNLKLYGSFFCQNSIQTSHHRTNCHCLLYLIGKNCIVISI